MEGSRPIGVALLPGVEPGKSEFRASWKNKSSSAILQDVEGIGMPLVHDSGRYQSQFAPIVDKRKAA
ncbi:unnamed protein product [Dovyalis caffra]|uniref:Uncharacterized protein n=1 Tax=Dovyalis caffra TaxID=77055 RepID=A0AAV1R4J2_9ROSI|nr:unnamed protein product [Dovyalis caffra]